MGVIGGLLAKHNDFNATGQHVSDSTLAAEGYNTTQGLPGQIQTALQQSNTASGMQGDLANQLLLRAQGKAGPSIAEQQLSQSLGQVQQQGAGALAAARGVSPGTAARLISNNQ